MLFCSEVLLLTHWQSRRYFSPSFHLVPPIFIRKSRGWSYLAIAILHAPDSEVGVLLANGADSRGLFSAGKWDAYPFRVGRSTHSISRAQLKLVFGRSFTIPEIQRFIFTSTRKDHTLVENL